MWCADTDSESFVQGIAIRFAFAATADFPQRTRALQPERIHPGVHGVGRKKIESEICAGVIAHHDHEVNYVAQGETGAIRQFLEHTAIRLFLLLRHDDLVAPVRAAFRYPGKS